MSSIGLIAFVLAMLVVLGLLIAVFRALWEGYAQSMALSEMLHPHEDGYLDRSLCGRIRVAALRRVDRVDRAERRRIVAEQQDAANIQSVDTAGVSIGGALGALVAQTAMKVDGFTSFTIERLMTGRRRGIIGVSLVVVGAALGFAANVISALWLRP